MEEKTIDRAKLKSYGLTKKEINMLINDYMPLPEENWVDLNRGIHIRYIHKTMGFRYGGYFVAFKFGENGAREKLLLENYKGGNRSHPGYKFYSVQVSNINVIFKQIAPYSNYELGLLQGELNTALGKIADLERRVEGLAKKINN